MNQALPNFPTGRDIVTDLGLGDASGIAAEPAATLANLASAVTAPLKRLAHRPWLQNLNDNDQEDIFEYHNPTLGLIAPRDPAL